MILTTCPGTPSTPVAFFGSHLFIATRRYSSVTRRSYGSLSCVHGMRIPCPSSDCSSRPVTKRLSRILATLPLLKLSGAPHRIILALTTPYGLPQGSCSRAAQNSFHFSSLLRTIALLNLSLAFLNSLTRPALSLLVVTALWALLLYLKVVRLRSDSSFHQYFKHFFPRGGKILGIRAFLSFVSS